jgi:hypothetical protein
VPEKLGEDILECVCISQVTLGTYIRYYLYSVLINALVQPCKSRRLNGNGGSSN